MNPILWHFTCSHGHIGIDRLGVLTPNRHPLMPALGPIVWLTSNSSPERNAVGLTSEMLPCDRMEYRYRVLDPSHAVPWSTVRGRVRPDVLEDLERFAVPSSWWITTRPTAATLEEAPTP